MSILIAHGLPCNNCGSSDAMAEYENNFYCFSCKHSISKKQRKPSKYTNMLRSTVAPKKLILPEDVTTDLPDEARAYLYKYHFTDQLIKKRRIQWSDSTIIWSNNKQAYVETGPRIIFPYSNEEGLRYFEAKSLDRTTSLKYITVGGKSLCYPCSIGFSHPFVVIVEDMMSAMRIGEQYPVIALRGTAFNSEKLIQLAETRREYIIWLDSDAPGQDAARNLTRQLTRFGKVYNIKSKKDPKCYTNKEIKWRVDNVLGNSKHNL